MNPLVSVIVPVFNAEKYVAECLLSIREQTYANLEIIVVNDGSTDKTDEIICSVISNDPRFIYISRENRGLVATLNQMVDICKGNLIARMDADDVAAAERIAHQVKFLLENPKTGLVGTRTEIIDETGANLGFCRRPVSADDVHAYFLYGSPIAHPTVMFNLAVIKKDELFYNVDAYPVEDLELWLRLIRKHKIVNLPLPLLKYRITSSGISQTNRQRQAEASARAREEYFADYPSLVRLIESIECQSGRPFAKALRRFVLVVRAASSKGPFNFTSLLKIWARTVVRDVRAAE